MASDFTSRSRATGLVDVLDRVLDKGLVIAGDVRVSLAEVELLTIRIRLIVCSLDKAEAIGLDWWKHDQYLAPGRSSLVEENAALRRELRALEERVTALARPASDEIHAPASSGRRASRSVSRKKSRKG